MLRPPPPWWEVLSVPGSTGTPGPTLFPVSLASMADTLTVRRASAPPAPAVPSTFTFDAIGTRWCIDHRRAVGRRGARPDPGPDPGIRPYVLPLPSGLACSPGRRPRRGTVRVPRGLGRPVRPLRPPRHGH